MNKLKCLLMSLMAACASLQLSHAAVITSGCADPSFCTLEELYVGGSISIDDVSFSNWQDIDNFLYEVDLDTGDEYDEQDVLDIASIFVTGIDAVATGNPNEFILGLLFSTASAWSLPQHYDEVEEAELELTADYDVSASNGATVTAAELQLGQRNLQSDDSYVEVNLDSALLLGLQVYDEFIDPDSDTVDVDSDTFAATSSFQLTSNVQVGTFVQGGVELFDFSVLLTVQADSPPDPIPTPATAYLLLIGSACLFFQRRKLSLLTN